MRSRGLAQHLTGAIAALTIAAAGPAHAADYCIMLTGTVGSTYVGKGFVPPSAGNCAVWRGFCSKGCSPDNVQIGIVCTSSRNTHISFGLTTYYLASNRQFDFIRLTLPSHSGTGNLNYQNPALGTVNYNAKEVSCSPVATP